MPKPEPSVEPIQAAVSTWSSTRQPPENADAEAWRRDLRQTAPRRFTIYEPMALLPAGSFNNAIWTTALQGADDAAVDDLWSLILSELSKTGKSNVKLTHLAVNEGIPLQNRDGTGENIRRSPSGLRMLHGDFGPESPASDPPSQEDFEKAFWVSTKQNGIHQTWAPRWTMFSRGNVKEKARLLEFPAVRKAKLETAHESWAVDLYAGIGYFTFCYAKLGMRVLCWELNPWSVEALRRGAHRNKWSLRVIKSEEDRKRPMKEIISTTTERIVVFSENNENAGWRTEEMQQNGAWLQDVRHVNCGLLPTSQPTWEVSLRLTRTTTAATGGEAWLHLHENVGETEINSRRGEIEESLRKRDQEMQLQRQITVDKVERVKTYAPGVWHCVFDVHIINNSH